MAKSCLIFFQGKANSCLKRLILSISKEYVTRQIKARILQLRTPLPLPQQLKSWKHLLTCSYQTSYYNLVLSNEENSAGLRRPCATSSKELSQDTREMPILLASLFCLGMKLATCFLVPLQWDWSNLLVPRFSPGQRIWFLRCWHIRTPHHAPGGCYPQSG